MIHIHDINDIRIADYHSLKSAQDKHSEKKLFLTDGDKTTLNVLNSDVQMHSIFAVESFYSNYAELINSKILPEQQFSAPISLMENIVGFRLHSGVMAMAYEKPFIDPLHLKSPIIALNGIINSDNVGGIIRNAIGMGFSSFLFDTATSSPYLRRAVRVSMGTISKAECAQTADLAITLADLKKERQIPSIVAEITEQSIDITDFVFPEDFILVFGSEGKGIEQAVLAQSDTTIHIPMRNSVQSLNVSSTSAIMMYQATKRMK